MVMTLYDRGKIKVTSKELELDILIFSRGSNGLYASWQQMQ